MSKELTPDVLVNEKVSEARRQISLAACRMANCVTFAQVVARANKQAAAEEVAPDAVNAAW